jgi:hypothetical protein
MEQGLLVPNLSLEQYEIVRALDQRDEPQFEDPWLRTYKQVEDKKGDHQDADTRVGRLRELAYLQALDRWESPELAGYISDDFGLIGDALATDSVDDYLNGLLNAYLALRFPR